MQLKTQLKKLLALPLFLLLLQTNSALATISPWAEAQGNGGKVRLIASFYKKDGEKKLIAGLHFKLNDGWKIYGKDDSGFGLPPQLDFSQFKNYKSHQLIWPQAQIAEEKIGNETISYSYYKHEVIIPLELDLADASAPAELALNLDYGICKDVCVPANTKFQIEVSDEIDAEVLREIQKYYPGSELIAEKSSSNSKEKSQPHISLLWAMILAFIGGVILNIMPCVLPVLSIKLLSVIKHSDSSKDRIRLAFLSTVIGILFCFVIFAFLAIAIKLTGNSFGWGLQFQNPYFLITLVLILTFFAANLLGIFEISFDQFFATLLNRKISQGEARHNIFIPNFLSGVLAVLLATPCSAPFLGSAISFAIISEASVIFLIFLCIGLGLALPYLILIFSQKPLKYLPKPGAWMVKIKQAMAGLLIATIIWLLYVISQNIGAIPATIIAVTTVLLIKSLHIKSGLLRYLALIALCSLALALPKDFKDKKPPVATEYDVIWQPFREEEIMRHVIKGKVVLVDITADWCLTCKFNKLNVLHSPEIMVLLKRGDVIGLRGDLTKPDEVILDYMRRKNRFAIPFNAVYGPGAPHGILTSELLNKNELVEIIKKASVKTTN